MRKQAFLILGLVITILMLTYLQSCNTLTWQRIKGNSYYLSPNGKDDNPGTEELPWLTLQKANMTLIPGDVLILKDGVYNGLINPEKSGSGKDRPIVYISQNLHKSILKGEDGSKYIITLNAREFIDIKGFILQPASNGFGIMQDCNNIRIEDCIMEGSSVIYCPLEILNCKKIIFSRNDIKRVICRTKDSKIHGDGVHFIDCSECLIEGNTFHKIGHSPLRIWSTGINESTDFIIRDNCFHNGWGRNFELFNLKRCLFQNNIITEAYNGAYSADANAKVFFSDGIFRFNIIYDNWDLPLASISYRERFSEKGDPLYLENSRIYFNTFRDNPLAGWVMGSYINKGFQIWSNIFINNLFFNNGYKSDNNNIIIHNTGYSEDNLLINNAFISKQPGESKITIMDKILLVNGSSSVRSPLMSGNIEVSPDKIITGPEGKITLREPVALPLTYASVSGSGNSLKVNDARYFFDGFGFDEENGDIIYIGTKKVKARIIKCDIENNLLTLSRRVKWYQGDPVTLALNDPNPVVGAPDAGMNGTLSVIPYAEPLTVAPGKPVIFRAAVSGCRGNYDLTWYFDDQEYKAKDEFTHTFNTSGDYPVRIKYTCPSGESAYGIVLVKIRDEIDPKAPLIFSDFEEASFEEWGYQWDHGPSREQRTYFPELRSDGNGQCMCVTAANRNSMLATNIKLKQWSIDKYPEISFSYRIPKGVPAGIWLAPWPSTERPQRICIGGSSGNSYGKMPSLNICTLIDDGKWHTANIKLDEVKKKFPWLDLIYSFEFYTYSNTVESQKFWFDDFSIKPSVQ